MSKSRLGGAMAVTALTLSLVAAGGGPAQAAAAEEALLLNLTNATRAAAGIPPLTLDPALSSVARQWASSMAAAGTISHNTNLKNEIGSNWSKVGENVGFGGTVKGIHEALVNSPAHLRNILDPGFERIGIGVVIANDTVWLVQDFLTPAYAADETPAAPPSPAPAPAPPAPTVTTPAPTPTTTTSTTTTTTLPPSTTTTPVPDTTAGLPLRLALMVKHARLGVPK